MNCMQINVWYSNFACLEPNHSRRTPHRTEEAARYMGSSTKHSFESDFILTCGQTGLEDSFMKLTESSRVSKTHWLTHNLSLTYLQWLKKKNSQLNCFFYCLLWITFRFKFYVSWCMAEINTINYFKNTLIITTENP